MFDDLGLGRCVDSDWKFRRCDFVVWSGEFHDNIPIVRSLQKWRYLIKLLTEFAWRFHLLHSKIISVVNDNVMSNRFRKI